MTVLVTGSRGTVATTLIPLLLEHGVAVRAGSTDPSRSGLPDGVPVVPCNLRDPATFAAALEGIDSVFLYAEPSEIDAFIKEATAAGVSHIVLLSSTSALDGPNDNPLGDKHLTVENALSASSVKSTFLRSGTFAGNALAWAWPIKAGKAVDLAFPGAHTDPVHELDVAEAALAALTDPGLGGRAYTLTGPESLSFAQQVEVLAAVTSLPVTFNHVTRAEWKMAMAEYVPPAFADSLLDLWESTVDSPVPLAPGVEELIGRPARSFRSWAEDHAAAFMS
jgi:uncharacterized protein YbjT (DUF2867 family)